MGFRHRLKSFFTLDFKYLLTELLLIVAGILIALAVDSWWQQRQDRETERSYLSALQSELEVNRAEFEGHLQQLDADIASTNRALQLFRTYPAGAPPIDSLHAALRPLITIRTIAPSRAALDDILQSGGLQYITSDILRRAIANYEQQLDYDVQMQRSAAALWDGQLSVFNLNQINLSQLMQPDTSGTGPDGRLSRGPAPEVPALAYATRLSPESRQLFANRLVQRIILVNRIRQRHRSLVGEIRMLMFQLNVQLGGEARRNTISG